MIASAIFAAVAGLIFFVLAVYSLFSITPKIITGSGQPGENVVAELSAPDTVTIELEAESTYGLWIVNEGTGVRFAERVTVQDETGFNLLATNGVTSHTIVNGYSAVLRTQFTTRAAGEYVIEMPSTTSGDDSRIFLAHTASIKATGIAIFGGVAGILATIFCFIFAIGLGIGGGIWISSQRSRQKHAQRLSPPYYQGPRYG